MEGKKKIIRSRSSNINLSNLLGEEKEMERRKKRERKNEKEERGYKKTNSKTLSLRKDFLFSFDSTNKS